MADGTKPSQVSTLVVDESFATAGDQFVDLVREISSPKYLAALADRWKRDPRPWAREQIIEYLLLPMDRPGHEPVVKRLFKQAEENRDNELMGHFFVAFDRLVRRVRKMRYRYDWQARSGWREEVLTRPYNVIQHARDRGEGINPFTGEKMTLHARPAIVPKNGRLFSYRTRQYLRRRAWRYFRRMGFQRPAEYPAAIAGALALYRDDDLAKGENILDSWALLNAGFFHSPILKINSERIRITEGGSLGSLSAAPRFEELWKTPEAAEVLLDLVAAAQSRLVRVWAMQLLKRHHAAAMQSIDTARLLKLLDHADDEVAQFAAGLLETLPAADSWPIETWLQLLETRSVSALVTICEVMSKRVKPDRVSLRQAVEMACARATPVARLGLEWLKQRPVKSDADRETIAGLSNAECDAVGEEVAAYGLLVVGSPPSYRTDQVVRFFDSLNARVRRGAWDWLVGAGGSGLEAGDNTNSSAGYDDASLWSRLVETPYDDVKLRLVEELDRRAADSAKVPALTVDSLPPIWTAVLLNVHRGGRAKLTALRQISAAIANRPEAAEGLIPVMAVAIRSVRPPEVRAGLSSILTAVAKRPELEAMLAKQIPELRLMPTGAAP
jgi:hypothetical protein